MMKIYSPVEGMLKAIELVNDEVFSTKMMGDGVAIVPLNNQIFSPVAGKVKAVFPTGHAIGLEDESGVEILIHLGIDTVELNGKFFETKVTMDQQIQIGDLLVEADFEKIKEAGYENDAIIIVTNMKGQQLVKSANEGMIGFGDTILTIK